jgi:hypothetical protein
VLGWPGPQQIRNQDYHCYHHQQVNQAAGNVKAKAQKPQDEQNRNNRTQHDAAPFSPKASWHGNRPERSWMLTGPEKAAEQE